VTDSGAVFVALSESKLDVVSAYDVMEIFGPRFDGFAYLPAVGTREGILVAWQSDKIVASNCSLTANMISLEISPSTGDRWWFTTIYGQSTNADKLPFLEELRSVALLYSGQWAVAGDFDLILDERDKNQGSVNRRLMRQFRKMINDLLLKEATLVGRSFTWSNEREIPTLEKIDQRFSTLDWELAHPDNLLIALSSSILHHTPLLMATTCNITVKKRFPI
jgi:hypothetical protein